MGWIEVGFSHLSDGISGLWPAGSQSPLLSLIRDGIIGGVGGVLVFLPNIVLLFFGLALLEDTGYMARAAFVTSDAQVMTGRLQDLGVPEADILTFPYGVDTNLFYPASPPIDGGPRVVTNRKLETVYSVSTVIDAFPAVHETFPDATLAVAGDGSPDPPSSTGTPTTHRVSCRMVSISMVSVPTSSAVM